jgi:hypothetical protein
VEGRTEGRGGVDGFHRGSVQGFGAAACRYPDIAHLAVGVELDMFSDQENDARFKPADPSDFVSVLGD